MDGWNILSNKICHGAGSPAWSFGRINLFFFRSVCTPPPAKLFFCYHTALSGSEPGRVYHLEFGSLPTVHMAEYIHAQSNREVILQVAEVAGHAIRHDSRLRWLSSPGGMFQDRLTAFFFKYKPSTCFHSTPSSGPHLQLGPEGSGAQCSGVGCSPFSGVKRIN